MKDDLIRRQDAIDAVDEALTGIFIEHRDIAEKMIGKLPSAQPERMRFVQQAVNMIMRTAKSDSIKDKCFRNAARMIQNAIDGEPQDFEPIPDEQESSAQPQRKKGKWLVDEDGNMECPFCGNTCGFGNYCNECGADMRGIDNG